MKSSFNKVAGFRPTILLKSHSSTVVFLWILQSFKNTFFTEHLCATDSVYRNVKYLNGFAFPRLSFLEFQNCTLFFCYLIQENWLEFECCYSSAKTKPQNYLILLLNMHHLLCLHPVPLITWFLCIKYLVFRTCW